MAKGEAPKSIKASLYIDGKPAENSIKDVRQVAAGLKRELDGLKEGTEEFTKKAEEFQKVSAYLKEIKTEAYGVGDAFEKVRSTMKDLVESVAIGTLISQAIRGALAEIRDFISGSEKAYEDATAVQIAIINKLNQTGMVAGETSQQLKKYQETLTEQTHVEGDVVAKGEDVLLSYTQVRGYIYQQAIPAALNLTLAQNNGRATMETMAASAEKLGKALERPTEAKKVLKEMGILLTNQQEKEIKTLNDTNRLQQAQQIILDEVSKRYGNLSKTIAGSVLGPAQKFGAEMHEVSENIGGLLERGKSLSSEVLEPFAAWLLKATSTDLPEKLRDEQTELNGLVAVIVSTNENQTVRNRLIDEVQAKYPGFLGNIRAEAVTNDMLLQKLEKVNEQYRIKIFLASNEAKIKEIQEERNKAIQAEADARERVAKASGLSMEALARLNDQQVKALAISEKARHQHENAADMHDAVSVQNSAHSDQLDINAIINGRKVIEDTQKELTDLTGANAIYQEKLTKAQIADIDEQIAAIKKRMETEKASAKVTDEAELKRLEQEKKTIEGIVDKPQSGPTEKELEEAQRKYEELLRRRREYMLHSEALSAQYDQFTASELAELMAKNDKEVKALQNKYDAEIEKEQEFITKSYDAKGKLNPEANAAEVAKHQAEIDKLKLDKKTKTDELIAKQEKDLTDRLIAFNDQLNGKLQAERDKEIEQINKFYDQQKKDAGTNADELAIIEQKRTQALNDTKINEAKRFQEEKEKIEEDGDGVNVDKDKLALIKINKKYDAEILALKQKFTKEYQLTKDFLDGIALINKQRNAALNASGKTDAEKQKDLLIKIGEEAANTLFTISNRNRDSEANAQIKSLEDRRNQELSNANLTQSQKDAINKKYADQEAAIKKQQFEADKAAAAEQALINGALGVLKLWVNPGFPAAIPLAIALGAETLAQEAEILSQPTPAFSAGGLTNSTPAGYVGQPTVFRNSASGRPFLAGEAGAEWIAPNWMLSSPRYANIIGMLETARLEKRAFAAGGFNASPAPHINMPAADNSELVQEIRLTREAIHNMEVSINYQVFTREMQKIADIKSAANAKK